MYTILIISKHNNNFSNLREFFNNNKFQTLQFPKIEVYLKDLWKPIKSILFKRENW